MNRLLIIIPAYNEEYSIRTVLKKIPNKIKLTSIDILVINDGSTDETGSIARKHGAIVLTHVLNRGLGAALGTGFRYAVKHKYDFVITYDADGQHEAINIGKLLDLLLKDEADVVIGSRLILKGNMPILRVIVNWLSNILTFLLFNVWTTDSQSGLRAFNRKAFQWLRIRSQRMEVSSEIFKEIKRLRLRMLEVPINPIYTKYSLMKGQSIGNAPNVLWKLFLNRLT